MDWITGGAGCGCGYPDFVDQGTCVVDFVFADKVLRQGFLDHEVAGVIAIERGEFRRGFAGLAGGVVKVGEHAISGGVIREVVL